MGLLSNKIDREQLKPGDHIYSWRQAYIYAHHGIYVGDGMVIHFTRVTDQQSRTGAILNRFFTSSLSFHDTDIPCPKCGNQTRADGVILSCLDCFLSGGNLYRFEYDVSGSYFLAKRGGTCTLACSDSTEEVLRRAHYLLENGFGCYDVLKNNCEDFSIYCKTGLLVTNSSVGQSGQAGSYVAAASSTLCLITTKFCGLSIFGCGSYCIGRLLSDIKVRHEILKVANKVPVEKISEMAKED